MRFDTNALDLLQTYRRYREKFGKNPHISGYFGADIVAVADGLLGGHGPDPDEIEGIRKCLTFQVLRLRRRSWLRRVFLLGDERLFTPMLGYSTQDHEHATLIADSLMLTVTKYKRELREYHSNMAQIVLAEILVGFELLCGWIMRGVPVNSAENDLVAQIEVVELEQHIRPPKADER
ncbi:MAG: hypothetical protein AB7K63_14970 [Vicinamibacterales bacterium]